MKVFIVEDSPIMLGNLRSALAGISGVMVIGHAENEADAIRHIDALLPDVVILDIGLRNGAGIGLLKSIKRRHAGIKAMVLSASTDEFYFSRCMRAGADYFFDKAFQLMRLRMALWQWLCDNQPDNGPEVLPAAY